MPIEPPSPGHREALAARYRALLADALDRGVDRRLSDGEQAVVRALLDPDDDADAPPCCASLILHMVASLSLRLVWV